MSNQSDTDLATALAWIVGIVGAVMGLAAAENNHDITEAGGFFAGAIMGAIGGFVLGKAVTIAIQIAIAVIGVGFLVLRFVLLFS